MILLATLCMTDITNKIIEVRRRPNITEKFIFPNQMKHVSRFCPEFDQPRSYGTRDTAIQKFCGRLDRWVDRQRDYCNMEPTLTMTICAG